MLLIDIATPDAAAQVTPVPFAAAAWVPSAYLASALTAPVNFTAVAAVDGVALSWLPPPPGVATVIERAADVSGAPSFLWTEVAQVVANTTTIPATVGDPFWYRAAHVRFGIRSAYSAEISIEAAQGSKLQADIAAAAAAAEEALSGITGNASAIDSLTQRVDTVEGTTVAQATSITALQASVTVKNSVKTQSFPPAPLGLTIGDIWLDSDDGNKLYVWDGTTWTESADGRINERNRVFAQNAEPIGSFLTGDLWVDTDDGNRLYRWTGAAWVDASDSRTTANASATNALTTRVSNVEGTTTAQASSITALQSSLQGKNSIATQPTAPSAAGRTTGDVWIDSDDGNKLYVWNGSGWVESADGRINLRNRVFAQDATPIGTFIVGDIWVDTDDGNRLYRWTGTAWVDASDTRTSANANATTALTTRVSNVEGTTTAQANSIATLSTTVGGLTSTVTTQGASINGLLANYSLNLDVNGFITGYEFNNDGTTGDFKLRADKFSLVKPAGGSDTVTLAGGILYAESGTFGRYMGAGFGVGGVYTDWAGPKPASPAAAADAGAKFWIKKDGTAFFGGTVNLQIAGSGAQIGDQRCILPINVGSVGSRWDGLSLSSSVPATGSPASVTISASAATLRAGSVSVSYSAASAVVSQARSTTLTYQAYYLDPSYAGGAKSLNVTTNPNNIANSDAVIWVGSITVVVPADGTPGGGGGEPGGGCVDIAMWLRPGLLAGRVVAGDDIECSLPVPTATGTQMLRVQDNRISVQPCYRLTAASGAQVIASESTPMTLIDGAIAYIPDMLGRDVLVIDDDGQRWEPVVECCFIGHRPVARISVNENCYFAGVDATKRIATHNATMKP